MAFILNIETATTNCSVSISENETIIQTVELNEGYSHAENLHPFIQDVLSKASLTISNINAVAVSCGPGSYTGLRIGVSAAKGICYALNIPLIAINTLKILSQQAAQKTKESNIFFCPMIDARRMEIYTALFDTTLTELKSTEAKIVDEQTISDFNFNNPTVFFGNGMPKCKTLLEQIPQATFIEDLVPSSSHMSLISYDMYKKQQFENVAYFEPFYLKEFFLKTK